MNNVHPNNQENPKIYIYSTFETFILVIKNESSTFIDCAETNESTKE